MIKKDLVLKSCKIPLSKKTCIMGILNITPDSFSDGGKYLLPDKALDKAKEFSGNG